MAISVRIDKYLWAIRLFKTRTQASDAIEAGKVKWQGDPVKASRIVKPGDRYTVREGSLVKDIEVVQPIDMRMKAELVKPYFIDHTPVAEYEKLRDLQQAAFIYQTGGKRFNKSQRPTKKDRREMDGLQDQV
jgi:ribosome-associated heat shock protein Hsp15